MSELTEDDVAIDVLASQGAAAVGRVALAGDRAGGLLGKTVLVGAIDPCGECEVCRRGGAPVCPVARHRAPAGGVLGSRVIAAARWLVTLGEGLELPLPAAAAVPGDVALAYTLYARTGISSREPAVLVGACPVTRFLVEILRAKGITPTVVADPTSEAWCDWLLSRGATVARVSPDASDVDTQAAVTSAIAAQGIGMRPWRVIATSSDAAARAAALAGLRASLTLLAQPRLQPDLRPGMLLPAELIAREVTIIGVAGAHPDLVVEVAALCVKGDVDLVAGTSTTPNHVMRAVVTVH